MGRSACDVTIQYSFYCHDYLHKESVCVVIALSELKWTIDVISSVTCVVFAILSRFGSGLVIYWFGFIDELDVNCDKGIMLMDSFPHDVVTIA